MACRAQRTAKSMQTKCIRPNTTRLHVFTTCSLHGPHVFSRVYHVFTTCLPRVHHVFHHVFTTCSPRVHHVFTPCSPRVHHVFTTCSPRVHHVYTTCSLRVVWWGEPSNREGWRGRWQRPLLRLAARSTSTPKRPNNLMCNCAGTSHRQPTKKTQNLADQWRGPSNLGRWTRPPQRCTPGCLRFQIHESRTPRQHKAKTKRSPSWHPHVAMLWTAENCWED